MFVPRRSAQGAPIFLAFTTFNLEANYDFIYVDTISLPTAQFPITDYYCESLNRGKQESCDAPCAGQVYDGIFSAGNAVGKLQVDCDNRLPAGSEFPTGLVRAVLG